MNNTPGEEPSNNLWAFMVPVGMTILLIAQIAIEAVYHVYHLPLIVLNVILGVLTGISWASEMWYRSMRKMLSEIFSHSTQDSIAEK